MAAVGPDRRHAPILAWLTAAVLGAVTLLLTVPRWTDPSRPRLVELVALTPFGVPPAVLLLAVTLSLARRTPAGSVRRLARGLLVGSLGLVAVHAWWLAPLFLGPTERGHGPALVVLTANLEYGDAAELVEHARHVDVLVLTDLTAPQLRAVERAGVRRSLPYSVGAGPAGPEGSVVFGRHPLRAAEDIAPGGRSRVVELLSSPLGPTDLVVVHPAPPYHGPAWRTDYTDIQAALETRYAVPSDRVVVVAGDFNATLDHAPLRRLLRLGFSDAVAATNGGFLPTWPAARERRLGLPVPRLVAIDHVLVSAQARATAARRVPVAGADHDGLLVVVRRAG